jgi:hypothetical protein
VAAASNPPIDAEVTVIEKTHARVIRSQRETPSIGLPSARLPVARIWRQASNRVAGWRGGVVERARTASAGWVMRRV